MEIRPSVPADLPEIQRVYARARAYMKSTGNPNQWGDTSPALSLIERDFSERTGYVCVENGRICGVFALIPGVDPTYLRIDDGEWLNDEPYGTIHRIASDGSVPGILRAALSYASARFGNIRIDTHEDNRIMQRLLSENGFRRCGIIYLLNGDPRIAYQKIVKKEN